MSKEYIAAQGGLLGKSVAKKRVSQRKRRRGVSARHAKQVKNDKKYALFPELGKIKNRDIYLAEFIAKGEGD